MLSLAKTTRSVQVPAPSPGKGYFYVGLALLAAFLILAFGPWRWPWLTALQNDEVYKQLSGFGLLGLIAYQWRFSALRAAGETRRANAMILRHKWIGALAPVLFYLHAQGFGHAYTQVLGAVFLVIVATGLFNQEISRVRRPWFYPTWIVMHVGSSMLLLALLGYHVYITYVFE